MSNALNDARLALASLPLFAQSLAGSSQVNVVISSQATTASTNGKRITIPALPLPANESDIEAAKHLVTLVRGFIPHEVGHVRHTEMSLFRAADQRERFVVGMLNSIEDPRQEVVFIREFPGAKVQLDQMCRALIGAPNFYNALKPDDHPSWLLSAYVLYLLRAALRGQTEFAELAEQSRDALVQVFGDRLTNVVEDLVEAKGPALRSTADARRLAERLVKAVEDEQELQKQEQEDQAQEDASSDGQEGEDQAQDGDSGADAAGDTSSSSSDGDGNDAQEDGGGDSSNGDATTEQAGDAAGSDTSAGGGTGKSTSEALDEVIRDAGANGVKDLGDMLANEISETIDEIAKSGCSGYITDDPSAMVDTNVGYARRTPGNRNFDASGAMLQSGRLRALMKNELQALQMQREHESVRGSLLNQRRIHRTSMNDRRLFVHMDDRRELNTAVFLLCDVSGSMSSRIGLASQAMYATAVALDGLNGVSVAAGTFPAFEMALQFGEKAQLKAPHFHLIASGGTPLAEAVLWASRMLMTRREDRKVLMVVTDGCPNSVTSAQAQLAAAEAHGIETMGLGINLPMVKNIFHKSAVIDSIEELSPAMLSMVRGTLRSQLQAA